MPTLRGSALVASDATSFAHFGRSIAFSDDGAVLAIGAHKRTGPSGQDNAGGVYIYDWSGSAWVQRGSVLLASDIGAEKYFGSSVALSADGTVLVVGSEGWTGTISNQGGVYIYDWSGSVWVQRGSVLVSASPMAYGYFGSGLSLSSDAAVLAVGYQGRNSGAGGVNVYDWSGSAWVARSLLIPSDPQSSDNFGADVSLSADGLRIAVGSPGWEGPILNQGGVYIYDWSGSAWVLFGTVITAPDATSADPFGFGQAVELSGSGTSVAIGAPLRNGSGSNRGSFYVFDWLGGSWTLRDTAIGAPSPTNSNEFSRSIGWSSDGLVLAAGAPLRTESLTQQGVVYVYDYPNISIGQPVLPIALLVVAIGQPELDINVVVSQITGAPSLPVRVVVLSHEQFLYGKLSLPISVAVVARGSPFLPLSIAVNYPSSNLALPVVVRVHAAGQPALPVFVQVANERYIQRWRPAVVLGGVDISARLVNQCRISVEEGGARVATLSFVPFAGALSPFSLNNQPVTIDVVRLIDGTEIAERIFTGVVDLPKYDVAARMVTLDCTDDLQNRLKTMPQEAVHAIVGGDYHEALHGKASDMDGLEYAKARMATVTGHFGADRHGTLCVRDWYAPRRNATFAAGDIMDAQLDGLNRRAELVNQVKCKLEWRKHRLRLRKVLIRYQHPTWMTQEAMVLPPTLSDLLDTDGLDGWELYINNVQLAKDLNVVVAEGGDNQTYTISNEQTDIAATRVQQASLTYSRRWAQTVTDVYDMTVSAPASIASNGITGDSMTGAWSSEFDASAWERFEADTPALTLDDPSGDTALDYKPDEPSGGAAEAVRQMLSAARVAILGSHRKSRVLITVPGLPSADLDLGVSISVDGLVASGKVAGINHVLDFNGGSVVTEMAVALTGISNADIVVVDSSFTAPETAEIPALPADPKQDQLVSTHIGSSNYGMLGAAAATTNGFVPAPTFKPASEIPSAYFVNGVPTITLRGVDADTVKTIANAYYDAQNSYAQQGFKITLPGVDDAYRQPVEMPVMAEYSVSIPVSPLALTA